MMDRVALIIENTIPVDAVVIANGAKGDEWLEANPNAVEVTGLDPQPGVATGWTYDGEWVAPVPAEPTPEELVIIEARQSAITKLEALGLTVEEVKVAFGLSVEESN